MSLLFVLCLLQVFIFKYGQDILIGFQENEHPWKLDADGGHVIWSNGPEQLVFIRMKILLGCSITFGNLKRSRILALVFGYRNVWEKCVGDIFYRSISNTQKCKKKNALNI